MRQARVLWAVEFQIVDAWFARQPTYDLRAHAVEAARDLRKQFPGCGYRVAKYVRVEADSSRSRRSEP